MQQGLELHEAAAIGDCDALEEMLSSGKYDVNLKDMDWSNRTPLHWACAKGYVEVIRILLSYGARPYARMDGGWTPAHLAAEAGKLHSLRALHTSGAPVDKPDKYGDTPLTIARRYSHLECVKYLTTALREVTEKKLKTDYVSEDESDFETSNKES